MWLYFLTQAALNRTACACVWGRTRACVRAVHGPVALVCLSVAHVRLGCATSRVIRRQSLRPHFQPFIHPIQSRTDSPYAHATHYNRWAQVYSAQSARAGSSSLHAAIMLMAQAIRRLQSSMVARLAEHTQQQQQQLSYTTTTTHTHSLYNKVERRDSICLGEAMDCGAAAALVAVVPDSTSCTPRENQSCSISPSPTALGVVTPPTTPPHAPPASSAAGMFHMCVCGVWGVCRKRVRAIEICD